MVYIYHRDRLVAEHPLCDGRHALAIEPAHSPGAAARNARIRYADTWRPAADDPRSLDVEVRDPAVYDTLADNPMTLPA